MTIIEQGEDPGIDPAIIVGRRDNGGAAVVGAPTAPASPSLVARAARTVAALGLLAPACSPAPAPTAHRGTPRDESAVAAPSAEAAVSAGGEGEPPSSAPPAPIEPAPSPTTTVTVTVPATVARSTTTTTFVLPEQVDEPDEFDARDASTARVSWYGDESGTHTANGERYDPSGLTFAHRSMAFGTLVRFCGPSGCVIARCSDRGPAAWTGKTFDLSQAAFARVAPLSAGVATVTWKVVG